MNEPSTPERLEALSRRLERLLDRLDACFLERRVHARLALLSLLTGHHMLMLGPPGTAKSLLARAICRCVEGGHYFEYLLSRFTHPDELFGPVSIPGLKEEDYRRLTEGYLPDAHIAFLDEIFKANSAILNSLLTLINERVFHHGTHRDAVPLLALIGASNEPPNTDALAALFDRFLVRMSVQPLAGQENFIRVSLGELESFEPPREDRLTLEDIAWVRRESGHVKASPSVRQTLVGLREALHREEITASDRRWRWALELVKVAAVTSGRRTIEFQDLLLLQYCFGVPFETDAQVQRVVCREVLGGAHPIFDIQALRDIEAELRQPPHPEERFTQARTRRLQLLDEIEARCDALEQGVDERRKGLLSGESLSLWVHEIPPDIFTAMLVARTTLRDTLSPLRKLVERYRPELKNFSLVGSFFGAFVLQNQLRNVFFQPETQGSGTPLAWVSGPGEPPQRWAGLMEGGGLVIDPGRLTRPAPPSTDEAWHTAVLHIEVDDDRLFEVSREASPAAPESWFDRIWEEHQGASMLPERGVTRTAFLAMLEHYRTTTAVGSFPLPAAVEE